MIIRKNKRELFPRRWFPTDLSTQVPEYHDKHRYLRVKFIPKPSGKKRRILVPSGILRDSQYLALRYLSEKCSGRYPVQLLTCQTAYKRGSSAYKNACEHEHFDISVKYDLKNCFDSIPENKHGAEKHVRRFGRATYLKPKSISTRTKYLSSAVSVSGALTAEGIPHDIARWIADVGTFNGYLYQGSPLSPLLCNIVTKQALCKRMMKLATAYHMPLFEVSCSHGTWYIVVPYERSKDDNTVYVYNLESHDECCHLKGMANKLSLATSYHVPSSVSRSVVVEDMVLRAGEEPSKMLLRYAQKAWLPRRPGTVAKILRALSCSDGMAQMIADKEVSIKHCDIAKTVFTLYCDDGVFSSNNRKLPLIRHILRNVVRDSGFRLNNKKGIRIMKGHRRKITGFEVSKPPEGSPDGDRGVRLSWKERDKRYRRVLHYMRTGKTTIDLQSVQSFAGSLEYLRKPNPVAWRRYAREFYGMVSSSVSDPAILKMVDRFKEI